MSALSSASSTRGRIYAISPAIHGHLPGGITSVTPTAASAPAASQRSASSTNGVAPRVSGRRPALRRHDQRRDAGGPAGIVTVNVVRARLGWRQSPNRHAAWPVPGRARVRCPSLRASGRACLRRDETARRLAAAPRGMPTPVSATAARRIAPDGESTRTSPSNVNLNALERRLRTIFSHMSRSTKTGSGSGGQSTTSSFRRARSPSGRCSRDRR